MRNRLSHCLRSCCLALFCAAGLACFAGCGPYQPAGKVFQHRQSGLYADLPQGWLRCTSDRSAFVMTRDGRRLETISIRVIPVGKKLPGTKRVYTLGMLPHEIAELSLGLIEASDEVKNFSVLKVDVAKVAGQEGYSATAAFTDAKGLRYRLCLQGTAIGDSICEIQYTAAENVYYEKHLQAFERMAASAKVEKGGS